MRDDAAPPEDESPAVRPRRVIAIAVAAVGVAVCVGGVLAIVNAVSGPQAAPPGSMIATPFPKDALVEIEVSQTLPPGLELAEISTLPTIELETMEWMNELNLSLFDAPEFGAIEISDDRATVWITWFGEPSPTLQRHLDAAPEGLNVELRSADYRPGDLQKLVTRAMAPGFVPGVEVAMGYVETDASGIRFGLVEQPAGRTLDEIGDAFARALGHPDLPVEVEVSGAVVPLSG